MVRNAQIERLRELRNKMAAAHVDVRAEARIRRLERHFTRLIETLLMEREGMDDAVKDGRRNIDAAIDEQLSDMKVSGRWVTVTERGIRYEFGKDISNEEHERLRVATLEWAKREIERETTP